MKARETSKTLRHVGLHLIVQSFCRLIFYIMHKRIILAYLPKIDILQFGIVSVHSKIVEDFAQLMKLIQPVHFQRKGDATFACRLCNNSRHAAQDGLFLPRFLINNSISNVDGGYLRIGASDERHVTRKILTQRAWCARYFAKLKKLLQKWINGHFPAHDRVIFSQARRTFHASRCWNLQRLSRLAFLWQTSWVSFAQVGNKQVFRRSIVFEWYSCQGRCCSDSANKSRFIRRSNNRRNISRIRNIITADACIRKIPRNRSLNRRRPCFASCHHFHLLNREPKIINRWK